MTNTVNILVTGLGVFQYQADGRIATRSGPIEPVPTMLRVDLEYGWAPETIILPTWAVRDAELDAYL